MCGWLALLVFVCLTNEVECLCSNISLQGVYKECHTQIGSKNFLQTMILAILPIPIYLGKKRMINLVWSFRLLQKKIDWKLRGIGNCMLRRGYTRTGKFNVLPYIMGSSWNSAVKQWLKKDLRVREKMQSYKWC